MHVRMFMCLGAYASACACACAYACSRAHRDVCCLLLVVSSWLFAVCCCLLIAGSPDWVGTGGASKKRSGVLGGFKRKNIYSFHKSTHIHAYPCISI